MFNQFCIIGLIVLGACSTLPEAEKSGLPSGLILDSLVTFSTINTVTVDPAILEGWNFLYEYIQETEFVLCLEGMKSGDRIHIEGFRLARMTSTSAYKVAYEVCSGDRYIGTAHNHPPTDEGKSLCYQSDSDNRSFHADSRAEVDIVLCGENSYLWILKNGIFRVEKTLN